MSSEIFSGSEELIKLEIKILGGGENFLSLTIAKKLTKNKCQNWDVFFFFEGTSLHEYLIAQRGEGKCIMKGWKCLLRRNQKFTFLSS